MSNLKSAHSVQTITNVGYNRCDPGLYLQVAKDDKELKKRNTTSTHNKHRINGR